MNIYIHLLSTLVCVIRMQTVQTQIQIKMELEIGMTFTGSP